MNKSKADAAYIRSYSVRFIKKHKIKMSIIAALFLLSGFFDIYIGYMLHLIIDQAVKTVNVDNSKLLIYIFPIIGISLLTKLILQLSTSSLNVIFSSTLKLDFAEHLISLDKSKLDGFVIGDLISRANNDLEVAASFYYHLVTNVVPRSILLVFVILFLSWISWSLLVVSLIIVPIALYISIKFSKPIRNHSAEIQSGEGKISSLIIDSIEGFHVEKAYNLSRVLDEKLSPIISRVFFYKIKRQFQMAMLAPVVTFAEISPIICCIVYGGYLAINHVITFGELVVFLFLLPNIIRSIANIPEQFSNYHTVLPSVLRINEITNIAREREGAGADFEKKGISSDSQRVLELRDVSFGFEQGKNILSKVNLRIAKGEKILVVGRSGSGKTTLLHLISSLLTNTTGEILFSGVNYSDWKLSKLRNEIAVVFQETYLFPMTIYNNIAIVKQNATYEEVVNAAKMANAHDFILDLPHGYDYYVGDLGNRLSGGQRQKIAIARAFLKNAQLLLLDEPTSSLDIDSANEIQKSIDCLMKDKTVIMITHSLTNMDSIDKVLVVEDGVVVEHGEGKDFLALKGLLKD